MADFPSLEPAARSLVYGDYPQLTHEGLSGGNIRFLQGTDRVSMRLTLGYDFITEAEAQQLLDHFNAQQGTIIPFDLSTSVWAGYSSAPVSSSDYQWRYANDFQLSPSAPTLYNTSIELESVPI